jgi:hypothetical protein
MEPASARTTTAPDSLYTPPPPSNAEFSRMELASLRISVPLLRTPPAP